MNIGLIVGLTIGMAVFVALLIGGFAFYRLYYKKSKIKIFFLFLILRFKNPSSTIFHKKVKPNDTSLSNKVNFYLVFSYTHYLKPYFS